MDVSATPLPAFPFGIDSLGPLDALCAPVADDVPVGVDLRDDASPTSVYYQLREVRSAARNNERTALANGECDFIQRGDWLPIVTDLPAVLATQSKDLELVAWLIEALSRLHGFRGAAAGFTLAAELITQHGHALFPHPDEEGVATQMAALTGLNGFGSEGALIVPLKSIAITEGAPSAFSSWQCEQAFETAGLGDQARRDARSKRGFVTKDDIDRAVAATSPAFFRQVNAELEMARTAFARYQAVVDDHCADSPQPTARIEETLAAIAQTLRHVAGDKLQAAPASVNFAAESEPQADSGSPLATPLLSDRNHALHQLHAVAAFFRRTEPHSPISYAVEQAIHWSHLSLPELIGELIPDEGARAKYRTLAGIRPANE